MFSLTLLTEESVVVYAICTIRHAIPVEHRGASPFIIVWFSLNPALILPGSAVSPVPSSADSAIIPVTPNPDSLIQVFSKTFQKFVSLLVWNGCEVSLYKSKSLNQD